MVYAPTLDAPGQGRGCLAGIFLEVGAARSGVSTLHLGIGKFRVWKSISKPEICQCPDEEWKRHSAQHPLPERFPPNTPFLVQAHPMLVRTPYATTRDGQQKEHLGLKL